MFAIRLMTLTIVLTIAVFLQDTVRAADDVIVDHSRPARLVDSRVVLDAETIERMVYGADESSGRKEIEKQIESAIRDLDRRYVLTDEMRQQLALAARSDKGRFLHSVEELKEKSSNVTSDERRWFEIQSQTSTLRGKRHALLSSGSFFAKVKKRILAAAVKRDAKKNGQERGETETRGVQTQSGPRVQRAIDDAPADAITPENRSEK